MKVKVIPFGVLKNWLGAAESEIELPEGSTVAALLELLISRVNAPLNRSIAVGVNAEFSSITHVLCDGDEVGLLPRFREGLRAPWMLAKKARWWSSTCRAQLLAGASLRSFPLDH